MKPPIATPPKLAKGILLRFHRSDLAEEVAGDLEEKFTVMLKTKSPFMAKLNYSYQVLNYLRPFAIRKSNRVHLNHYDMLQNPVGKVLKIDNTTLVRLALQSPDKNNYPS